MGREGLGVGEAEGMVGWECRAGGVSPTSCMGPPHLLTLPAPATPQCTRRHVSLTNACCFHKGGWLLSPDAYNTLTHHLLLHLPPPGGWPSLLVASWVRLSWWASAAVGQALLCSNMALHGSLLRVTAAGVRLVSGSQWADA